MHPTHFRFSTICALAKFANWHSGFRGLDLEFLRQTLTNIFSRQDDNRATTVIERCNDCKSEHMLLSDIRILVSPRSWDDWKDANPRGSGNKMTNVG